MFTNKRYEPLLVFFMITLLTTFTHSTPLNSDWPEESGILEPVQIFDQFYGTDHMHKVAQVVTDDFRNGQPESEWTAEVSRQLRDIKYERMGSEIKGIVTNEDTATVLVRVEINSIVGPVQHDEIFRLIRDGDTWLIDDLEVVNEKIRPKGIEI